MVHKPKHKVHSFRGLLGDGGQDEINLERSNVNLAYRLIKLQLMPREPAEKNQESTLKIYKEQQTSFDAVIDFNDPDLLAAGWVSNSTTGIYYPIDATIIFDNILFSRNIWISQVETLASESLNYYIEIEEVPVGAATLMQLKLGVARKLNLSQSAPDA